jgi:hypothetical protein
MVWCISPTPIACGLIGRLVLRDSAGAAHGFSAEAADRRRRFDEPFLLSETDELPPFWQVIIARVAPRIDWCEGASPR